MKWRVPRNTGAILKRMVSNCWAKPELGQRNFAWYMSGAAVSLGMWAQRIAVGWLTWEPNQFRALVGVIAFADLFPTVVITPIAGAIADRTNRLWMARISQFLAGCQAFVLAWMAFNGHCLSGGCLVATCSFLFLAW